MWHIQNFPKARAARLLMGPTHPKGVSSFREALMPRHRVVPGWPPWVPVEMPRPTAQVAMKRHETAKFDQTSDSTVHGRSVHERILCGSCACSCACNRGPDTAEMPQMYPYDTIRYLICLDFYHCISKHETSIATDRFLYV